VSVELIKDGLGYHFTGRDFALKFGHVYVQIAVIVSIDDQGLDGRVDRAEVSHHARDRVRDAFNGHFQNVVVPVASGMIALSVEADVFFGG
jgi:hypothetical protein